MDQNPENRNPWKIEAEEMVYTNPWISVTQFDVINPSGKKGIYGKVHFRNKAIGILALDEHLNTWLIGQWRFPIEQYSWEIPEGGGPLGTDPLESAKRELEEEAGITATEWTELFQMHLSNSVSDEHGIVYLARGLRMGENSPEETEELVVKKLPFEEAYQMLEKGLITDSMSVAAILKVKMLLLNGNIS